MNEDKEKKLYELAILVKDEADMQGVLALLTQYNAEALSEPRAKKLALAYKIKKHTEAIFVSLTFRVFPDDAKNLERDLVTRKEIIRSLIMVAPKVSERPTTATPSFPSMRRGRPTTPYATSAPAAEAKPAPSRPLSNEALEKKIEEILQ